ncbi:MAG: tail fiber domain-containing protein [Bacteroidota bacterium]
MQVKLLLLSAIICIGLLASHTLHAQVGTPNGTIQFATATNFAGAGPLGHRQSGTFGDIVGLGSNWAALGQSPVIPGLPTVYGLRLQRNSQFAVFNLVTSPSLITSFPSPEDLVIGFGENKNSKIRLRFIADQFAGKFSDVLTVAASNSVGVNESNPSANVGLTVIKKGSRSLETAILAISGSHIGVDASSPVWGNRSAVNSSGKDVLRGYQAIVTRGVQSSQSTFGVESIVKTSSINTNNYAGFFQMIGSGFAGFFDGDVTVTGAFSSGSDVKLKREIKEEAQALDRIMQLQPTTYFFDREEYPQMSLAKGLQHGFVAQELQEVFPELVTESAHPNQLDPEAMEATPFEYLSVNYLGLISILTKAVQEQQQQIQMLQAQVQDNATTPATEPATLGTFGKATLFQNAPNPFSENTLIRYQLPQQYGQAAILLFDMQGRQIQTFDDLPKDGLTIDGNSLDAGMYLYSLIIDGEEIATKRMILTK